MSFKDFEVAHYRMKIKDFEVSKKLIKELDLLSDSAGYIRGIIINTARAVDPKTGKFIKREPYTIEDLEKIFNRYRDWKVTDKMVENKDKKIIIMQARGFRPEDLEKVKEKIGDALLEYDFEITILDERIALDNGEKFFNTIAKDIKIYHEIKERKKSEYKEQIKSSSKSNK